MKVRKAVIPAAGLGTRFLPATKSQPKEMLPIVDKPTIQYIVEEAAAAGVEDIIVVTGRNKRSIEDHFDRSIELEMELERKNKEEMLQMVRDIPAIANIHFIRQKQPLGLGHAVLTASHFIGDEPFAVLLGDDVVVSKKPALQQMVEVFNEYKTSILGVQEVSEDVVSKYGIVDCKHVSLRSKIWSKSPQSRPRQAKSPFWGVISSRRPFFPSLRRKNRAQAAKFNSLTV